MTRRVRLLLPAAAFLFLASVGAACAANGALPAPVAQTLTPMSALIVSTETARAASANTNNDLSTAVANATQQANTLYSTQTAIAALNEPSRLATATAIAPAVAELPLYDIDPASGYVAWVHPPVTINLQGYQQTGYANNFQNITAGDLVMAADITWHTVASASGCGFMFRSNGDTNKPSQYMVVITRVASGHLAFLGMVDGKIANYRSFYPKTTDKSFNWFNDATNRLAVVARGNLIDLYTNGQWIGQVDVSQPPSGSIAPPPMPELPPGASDAQVQDYNNQLSQQAGGMDLLNGEMSQAQQNFSPSSAVLTDGFLGFVGLSQSGTTTCTFSNAWLFIPVK